MPRNLLLRFAADDIDETPALASTLQSSVVAAAAQLELTVKVLPGDHARPLQQDLGRISPDLARAASQAVSQGESLMGQLGSFVQQAGLPEQAASQVGRGGGVCCVVCVSGSGLECVGGGGLSVP